MKVIGPATNLAAVPSVTPADPQPPTVTVRDSPLRDIDPVTLYQLLALRVDVFVVEQACAYPELDGRDLEPAARLVWAESAARPGGPATPVATLRVLVDPDGSARIGRVATAASARSAGVAARLMHRGLELGAELAPGHDAVLNAQAHLEHWYARFGFVRDGADFDEDGIAHVPMRRAGTDPSK
jgi:ElaA protein